MSWWAESNGNATTNIYTLIGPDKKCVDLKSLTGCVDESPVVRDAGVYIDYTIVQRQICARHCAA